MPSIFIISVFFYEVWGQIRSVLLLLHLSLTELSLCVLPLALLHIISNVAGGCTVARQHFAGGTEGVCGQSRSKQNLLCVPHGHVKSYLTRSSMQSQTDAFWCPIPPGHVWILCCLMKDECINVFLNRVTHKLSFPLLTVLWNSVRNVSACKSKLANKLRRCKEEESHV